MLLSVPLSLIVLTVLIVIIYPADVGDRIDRIKIGMTEAEVRVELGPPLQEVTYADGQRLLAYPHGFHDPYVIELDNAGVVTDIR
jgi:hypothetical protein